MGSITLKVYPYYDDTDESFDAEIEQEHIVEYLNEWSDELSTILSQLIEDEDDIQYITASCNEAIAFFKKDHQEFIEQSETLGEHFKRQILEKAFEKYSLEELEQRLEL